MCSWRHDCELMLVINDRCRPDIDDRLEGVRRLSSRCSHDDVMAQPGTRSISPHKNAAQYKSSSRMQQETTVKPKIFVQFPESRWPSMLVLIA